MNAQEMQHKFSGRNQTNQAAVLSDTGRLCQRSASSFSTVNRWEGGKTKPNLTAMKHIKEFCLRNGIEYSSIEEAWLDYTAEAK